MIRPIEMQMLLPRTESVGNMQQNEIQHSVNVNMNAANEVVKNEQKLSEAVVEKEEKQFDTFQYDAKEEGNNKNKGSQNRRRKSRLPDTDDTKDLSFSSDADDNKEVQPRINFQI